MNDKLLDRIVVDMQVLAGKPIIRGTRIPVELILRQVAQGIPEADILENYPRLQPEDIRAALTYAAHIVANDDIEPIFVN